MSIIVAYLFLSIAIVTEVIGTIYLRDTEGFTRLTPSVITAVSYAASFYFISLTLKQIPVAVTYAIWSGVGPYSGPNGIGHGNWNLFQSKGNKVKRCCVTDCGDHAGCQARKPFGIA